MMQKRRLSPNEKMYLTFEKFAFIYDTRVVEGTGYRLRKDFKRP